MRYKSHRDVDIAFAVFLVAALLLTCIASYYSLEIMSGVDTGGQGYINVHVGESASYCFRALKVCIVF